MAEPTPNTPSPIKTIVILVQENRSFDHILGFMKSLNSEIDGITGNESNLLSTSNPDSTRIPFIEQSGNIEFDPGHTYDQIYEQIFGVPWTNTASEYPSPTMDGFAQQAESLQPGMSQTVMSGYKPDALPVYKELVTEFAVCDRWFSSVPSLTQPNRLFIHSATSSGATDNDTGTLIDGYPQKTIFESLEEENFTFGIYYQYPPSTLFYRNLRKVKYIDNFYQFDLNFKDHCEEGKLPNYVVIEQRYFGLPLAPGNDDHPPHDLSDGQDFVRQVYEALRASPQWNEILFVVLYDEHGGFYDHVPTPIVGVPSPDGIVGPAPHNFKFDRLGVRVPAILVSPWIEPGTVLHRPSGPTPTSEFEHSSIPATVKKIFNLKNFLTKRDEWAGTFDVVLNRTTPRTNCPDSLPQPVKTITIEPNEEAKLTDFQGEIVQLAAVLNGDHVKEEYPHKMVENMKVSEAVNYSQGAFQTFRDECDKARKSGVDGQHIVCLGKVLPQKVVEVVVEKTMTQKIFSCLVCDQS